MWWPCLQVRAVALATYERSSSHFATRIACHGRQYTNTLRATEAHELRTDQTLRLQQSLLGQLKRHGLAQPLLEIYVEIRDAEVPLRVYEGEVLEQVADEFATAHELGFDESEAVRTLLDEQLVEAGLLSALEFMVPIVVAPNRVAQLPVHAGDDPWSIADAFVKRHARNLWPAIVRTRDKIIAAIYENRNGRIRQNENVVP